jgi:hypothetical protein
VTDAAISALVNLGSTCFIREHTALTCGKAYVTIAQVLVLEVFISSCEKLPSLGRDFRSASACSAEFRIALVFARIECAVSSKSPFSLFFSKKTSSHGIGLIVNMATEVKMATQ